MATTPPISNAEKVAQAKAGLDKMTDAESSGGKKIIGKAQNEVKPIPTPNERKRLAFESSLFWDVYFKKVKREKGKLDKEAKGKEKGSTDGKKGVGSDIKERARLAKVDKSRVTTEATIFWDVYYKVKKQKDPPKDTKPKTKISPAKKAVDKVCDCEGLTEKPKKEGKGFIGWLMGLFAPFAAVLAPLLSGGLLAALGGAFTTLMAAIGPLIVAGAGIFALVAAVGFAAVQIGKAWKGWKDMRQAQAEAKKAEEDTKIESKALEDVKMKSAKKAMDAGDKDAGRFQELMAQQVKGAREVNKAVEDIKGGWGDQLVETDWEEKEMKRLREEHAKRSEAISKEMSEIRKRRANQNASLKAAGKKQLPDMGSYHSSDAFWLAGHRNKGVGIYHKDPAKRAHAEKMREEKGLPKIKVEYYGPRDPKKEPGYRPPGNQRGRGRRDFVSRPGMPDIPFDSKDDILGFKQGGPVSNLLKQATTDVKILSNSDKFGKFQLDAISLSNAYLKTLVELTAKMLQKGSAGGVAQSTPPTPVVPSDSIQGNMGGPSYSDSRSDFYGSAYSMHTPSVPA